MSSNPETRLWITAAALLAAALLAGLPARAQYPGQIAKPDASAQQLRAVGVLEWTGDQQHPKASRLIPICIYDGQELQDAGIYLAQPAPIALQSEVEYQLYDGGKSVGLFDITSASQQLGSWIGLGKFKQMPAARRAPAHPVRIDEDDAQSDVPVLHRKHHAADTDSGSGSGSSSGQNAPPPDSDRPTLHKGGDAPSSSASDSSADANAPAPDSDRPVLHKTSAPAAATAPPAAAPEPRPGKPDYEGNVSSVESTDPSRPRLFRGKAEGYGAPVLPTLIGLPPDMNQQVAVSDPKTHPEHLWAYEWTTPTDEDALKSALEDQARTALGLNPPPSPPAAKPAKTALHKPAHPAPPPPPAEPAPLLDENFRVYELAYNSGATLVLTARAQDAAGLTKYVTLIAQPDLYGKVNVIFQSVADSAHLDVTPRMRLVDAVDALADNRGELLFELRSPTQRQFALYRVYRGQATRIFLSGPIATTVTAGN